MRYLLVISIVLLFLACSGDDMTNRSVQSSLDQTVDIPGAFSPDGDGVEDVFFIRGSSEIDQIEECRIYNRWGELVYESVNIPANDARYGWDGMHNDVDAVPGAYVYKCRIKFSNDSIADMTGAVTLIR